MIRSYNDHAANERTLLAWLRSGLSSVTLGIVVKKGSLLAAVTEAASREPTGLIHDHLGNYAASALIGLGFAAMIVAAVRFVRTARRIDDQNMHSVGIIRIASALLRQREDDSASAVLPPSRKRDIWQRAKRLNLRLVRGAGDREIRAGASQANHPVKS